MDSLNAQIISSTQKEEYRMANEELVRLLKQGSEPWNAWRMQSPDAQSLDLGECDLSGLDLHGINLSGANLSSARLHQTNLSHANLTDADLVYADLSQADLSQTNLSLSHHYVCMFRWGQFESRRFESGLSCRNKLYGHKPVSD